jgi:hypothetical protein
MTVSFSAKKPLMLSLCFITSSRKCGIDPILDGVELVAGYAAENH